MAVNLKHHAQILTHLKSVKMQSQSKKKNTKS